MLTEVEDIHASTRIIAGEAGGGRVRRSVYDGPGATSLNVLNFQVKQRQALAEVLSALEVQLISSSVSGNLDSG